MADEPPDDGPTLFPLPAREPADEIAVVSADFPLWTTSKASLIAHYLRLFVHVTKHGNYIDGFAGPQDPQRRGWAAQLVLEGQASPTLDPEKPKLRHFYLCDQAPAAVEALEELRASHADRDIRVFPGDFNQRVADILQPDVLRPTEATFCLIDQRTFECDWDTIRRLATYKPQHLEKIELFYFLAAAWLDRAIAALGAAGQQRIRAWWGRNDWKTLLGLNTWRRSELIRKRFLEELGYLSVKAWPIYEAERGSRLMYHMIHATDHVEAPKLMQRAHRLALFAGQEIDESEFPLGLI